MGLNKKEDGCLICGYPYVEKHHIFNGANRRNSEKYGCVCYLCHQHHNEPPYGAHFDRAFRTELEQAAQKQFEETHSREEFMKIFGRNYLED